MPLDLFQQDADAQLSWASRNSAPELPVEFGEGFSKALNESYLFSQSVSHENARRSAIGGYGDEVFAKTEDPEIKGAAVIGDLDLLNARVAQLAQERPELGLVPLTDDELEQRAIKLSRGARTDFAEMSARERTTGGAVGSFLGSLTGGGTDPVNLVALPVAAPAGLGILATGLAWGGIAGGTQAAIQTLAAPYQEQVEPGYGASSEPAANILGAVVTGGAIGGGLKGLANTWTRVKTGQWPRSIRDAGNVVESEANIANSNPFPGVEGEVAHRTAFQKSIDDLIAGRPVDVDSVVTPSILNTYDQRLYTVMNPRAQAAREAETAIRLEREGARLPPTVERLSEVQLSEIRTTGQRVETGAQDATAKLTAERAAITAERGTLVDNTPLRTEVDGLRADLESANQRAAEARPPIDQATQDRLDTIDAELQKTKTANKRALLTAERESITQTLEKTQPVDSRLAGSLAAEVRGLEKALARKEKDLAKAEAKRSATEQKLGAREASLPKREQSITDRAASQRAGVATEMRKSVSTLASEGYGVRLSREEAQAFADRILAAGDNEIDDALREVTESLVDRRLEARRGRPSELPFGTSSPIDQTRARAGFHTEEMRKSITALAREVGYEIPREEAAKIAAHIAKLPEQDALAVLDELMLRPRTLAEFLPGTSPTSVSVPTERVSVHQQAATDELVRNLTPEKVREARADPVTDEAVTVDLDRLRATKDVQVPVGETIGPDGKPMVLTQSLDKIMEEFDARIEAANEIKACATPQTQAAE